MVSELPQHTVLLVLKYIEDLPNPIPPDLLSIPLRQRHHFLNIGPADPEPYLCWPNSQGSDPSTVVQSLLSFEAPNEFDAPHFPYRYSADPEHVYAHVSLTPLSGRFKSDLPSSAAHVRLVFMWDPSGFWKFHDAASMPWPPTSVNALDQALASFSVTEASSAASPSTSSVLPRPAMNVSLDTPTPSEDDNDSSYWDSYGRDDPEEDNHPRQSPSHEISEDAYWSQYSSVQGSADSTVPSPVPPNAKSLRPLGEPQSDLVLTYPTGGDIAGDPYSGNFLSDNLASQSLFAPPPADSSAPTGPSSSSSSLHGLSLSGLQAEVQPSALQESGLFGVDLPPLVSATDSAAKESIRGVFKLWKASAEAAGQIATPRDFLQLVQDALDNS